MYIAAVSDHENCKIAGEEIMRHILTRPVFMQCVSTSDSYIQVCTVISA